MVYAVSDIHGCYEQFLQLLEKINFTDQDKMFILGDMVDRGPQPMKLLQDLMVRHNVYPLLGNHDYVAQHILRKLNVEITAENVETYLTEEDILEYAFWMKDGGSTTAKQFVQLTREERKDILEYMSEFALYEKLAVAGRKYVLVHAGINGFDAKKPLGSYQPVDFVYHRADYKRRYYEDGTYLVTGHTPTVVIREDMLPIVYEEYGHIAIDCGCVFGKRLAAYCLNTGETFYVPGYGQGE